VSNQGRVSVLPGHAQLKRIVIYGRPSSGKTCFLSALAMPRLPHAGGYSCIWVCDSQSVPTPSGRREDWNPNDPRVALYLGREWLQKSIDAIQNGDVPHANPNDITPYRLLFDLTMPDGRIIRIEMVDYSGELVDPNLAEDVLAKQLLGHLENADGVLVLAEVPKSQAGDEENEMQLVSQHRELQILQQALMLVAEKRRKGRAEPIPFGMLLNKWDRYTSAERYDETTIAIEKDVFMQRKPPVPQQVLFNVLKAVAGSTGAETFSESFAVSAFGKTKTVVKRKTDGSERRIEVPLKVTPLQSYGLEDPLIWVCEKSGNLEMRKFSSEVADLAPWKIWQVPPRQALSVRSRISALRRRVPAHLPQARSLDDLSRKCLSSFARQCAFAAMLTVTLLIGMSQFLVYQYDNWQYTRIYPALRAIENDASPIEWAEKWRSAGTFLADYCKPSYLRIASHWYLLSPDSAKRHLALLQPKLVEADRIIALRNEFDIRVSGLVKQASASEDPKEVTKLRAELDAFEVPVEYPDGGPKKAEGLTAINQRIVDLGVQQLGEDTRRAYHNYMSGRDLAGAAELLSNKERQSPTVVASLRSDFLNRWDTALLAEVQTECEGGHWAVALRALDDFENSREAVKLTAPNGRIRRDELRRRVETFRSEAVYSTWYNDRKSLTNIQDVMQFGTAADRAQLQNWRKYDEFAQQSQTWEITIEEIFVSDYGGSWGVRTRTDCSRDGTNVCRGTWTFDQKPETARPNAKGSTTAKVDEKVSLVLTYTTLNFNYGNFSSEGSWSGTPQELMRGVSVTIITPAGYSDPVVKLQAKLKYEDVPSLADLRVPRGGSF
jgi:hypothetical protein